MASSEVLQPTSGNTSQDSRDSKGSSGGQKSMLELLSITDAAVKALSKSTRSLSSTASSAVSHHTNTLATDDHSGQLHSSVHSDHSAKSHGSDHSAKSRGSEHSVKSSNSDRLAKSCSSDHSAKSRSSDHSVKSRTSDHSVKSRSSGHSSHESHHSSQSGQKQQENSYDSGVASKTHTVSEDKTRPVVAMLPADGSLHERSSDESTTASDILIRSTLVEKTERSINSNNIITDNASITSKCSKTSFGVENFNSSGPQKVKISRKRLKEIKPPFDDDQSPRESTSSSSSDGKVPSSLLGISGNKGKRNGSKESSDSGRPVERKVSPHEATHTGVDSTKNGARSFPRGVDNDQFRIEKVRKSVEKSDTDVNMSSKPRPQTQPPAQAVENNLCQWGQPDIRYNGPQPKALAEIPKPTGTVKNSHPAPVINGVNVNNNYDENSKQSKLAWDAKQSSGFTTESVRHPKSAPKYFVERHTPPRGQPTGEGQRTQTEIPERKNLLHDLEESVEIQTVGLHSVANSSGSSNQPEILTVPERIVNVFAVSPATSLSSPSDHDVMTTHTAPPLTTHSVGFRLRDDNGRVAVGKNEGGSPAIPPALTRRQLDGEADERKTDRPIPAQFQWFNKQANGHGLQQGAPVVGPDAPDRQTDDDVQITQFRLNERQRMVKESFAKRQGGPVRRIVQPKIVGHDSRASSTSSAGEQKVAPPGQASREVLTAAAAASAAVSATQPFLQAQHEMEARMAAILEKVSALQDSRSAPPTQDRDAERVAELERQISALTERRIEYMETLQAQQMDMQVKLLSMTRDIPGSRSVNRSPEHYRRHDTSTPSAGNSKRTAFSKTTVPKPSLKGSYSDQLHKYGVIDPDDSTSPLDTPAPRSRAPKPTTYDTSDIEFRNKPRSRSPAKLEHDRGILHQILASASPPVRDTSHQRAPPIQTRPVDYGQSPNVKKARDLVHDLSHISDQVKGLVTVPAADESMATVASVVGPSPLDPYLMIPEHDVSTPYKPVAPVSARQVNAPVLPGYTEAAGVLARVQQNRGFLEANLDSVMRARHDVDVYNLLDNMSHDGSSKEQAHIKTMVDARIERLRREVQKEVTDDVVLAELLKNQSTSVPGAVKVPASAPTPKPTTRYSLRNRLAEPKVEPKKPVVKRPGSGKENGKVKPRPAAKKAKSMFEDEEYMERIYGKAGYQRGRTTVKDPYMHFQNAPKQRAARPQGVVECKGTEMMSSKTQTGGVRQFYFNPSTGMYIPIANVETAAPVPGHLIPMAVALGGPRIDAGMSVSRSPKRDHVTFGSKQVAQVTAAGNVAMVSMPIDEEEVGKRLPELGRQVLPPVDIDTDVSDMSDLKSESVEDIPPIPVPKPQRAKKTVQITSPEKTPARSPTKAYYEVVCHEDSDSDAARMEDMKVESSITISHTPFTVTQVSATRDDEDDSFSDDDADVETATGVQLPGHQPTEPDMAYHGPVFPPKQPSANRQLTSDIIAEDIRRRDILQNNAVEWLEQELMARILTEVYPSSGEAPPSDLSHVFSEGTDDSVADDKDQSMFVMDSIGRPGLQLFIDAGYPVDNALVHELVRDVLGEKVRGMLGERPDQDAPGMYPQTDGATTILQQHGEPEDSEEEPAPRETYVRTPEPTPRASPTSSPPRLSPVATPRMSPAPESPRPPPVQEVEDPRVYAPAPVSEAESEVESSASYDIVEELARLTAKLRPEVDSSVESRYDVQTPPESPEPPAVEVYRSPTPPAPSPRPMLRAPTPEQLTPRAPVSPKSPVRERTPSPPPEVEEEELEDQPHPVSDDETESYRVKVVFTIAETQTDPDPKPRSPTPAQKPVSQSPSESSYSESSSISETFNECVSEGQWLINKSDGEVADFPIDDAAMRQKMLQQSQRKVDISSASTWKDIDDVDLEDMTELSRSEGEFLYKTPLAPEQDPVLHLLARLQTSTHQYGQYPMSQRQVANVLDASGRSVGEMLQHSGKSEGEVIQVASQPAQPRRDTRDQGRHTSPHRSKSPPLRSKSPPHRSKSPVMRPKSPNRVSFEDRRSGSPTRGILKQSSDGRPAREEDLDVPVRDTGGRSQTSTGRLVAGGRQPQGRGQTVMAGGRTSPVKSSMKKPPQVMKSATLPDSRSGHRHGVRGSADDMRDSRDSMDNMPGPSYYSSEFGTRTMTPDQMNTDALIQSGYLSQSFSQSEGTKPFADPRHSLQSSGEMTQSRLSASGRSLGLSYGTEPPSGRSLGLSYGTDASLGESELQRLATGSGTLRMSVTIPGTGGFDDESDLSEIDITDGGNTK